MPEVRLDLGLQNRGEYSSGGSPTLTSGPASGSFASNETVTLSQQRERRRRGEFLAAYFDPLAHNWDRYRDRNRYYHHTERALFRTYVPRGLAVLEMGCATGDVLAIVQPEHSTRLVLE
jgi:hypothetical protein